MILALDIGEVGFDAAEVRTIRGQKKDVMAVFAGDGFEVFLFMESSIVIDEGRVGPQFLAEHVPRPVIDKVRVGGAKEQHGGEDVRAASSGNQAFTRTAIAGVIAVNLDRKSVV